MRLALILCSLSAALCAANGLAQPAHSAHPAQPDAAAATIKAGGYPKKVTTLKKRPTKTPSTLPPTAAPASTQTAQPSKPSKPRVKAATRSSSSAGNTMPTAAAKAAASTAALATSKSGSSVPVEENFKNLPADDLEFIKELDKQFKLHGNKIKIKVERDNSTAKNSKRTIDGELGYGYTHQGYDYTPPKFMFYPYSQHDIPATEQEEPIYDAYGPPPVQQVQQVHHTQHQQTVTSVTIEPSYSYELKPQTSYETQPPLPVAAPHEQPPAIQIDLPQSHGQEETSAHDGADYQEPVIVLRIPGPAKYAAHLQTLLQQYLEIRAAQYLRLLEEAEQRKQQQHGVPAQSYGPPPPPPETHYSADVSYAHQVAPTPPPVQYPAIDEVYQSYKGRHHQQPQSTQYEQHTGPSAADAEAYYAPPQTQFYYAQPAQPTHYEPAAAYQPQLYLIAMAPSQQQVQQPIYVPEVEAMAGAAHAAHAAHATHAAHAAHAAHELPITENNPRSTHTKVVFTQHGEQQGADYAASMYALPSIRPYERHAAADHIEQQQQEQQQQQQAAEQQAHEEHAAAATAEEYQQREEESDAATTAEAVSITQRPFNYHAHGRKMAATLMRHSGTAKRDAPPLNSELGTEHRLQQIREFVRDKLGAEMGSAVEYKTTQLLEG